MKTFHFTQIERTSHAYSVKANSIEEGREKIESGDIEANSVEYIESEDIELFKIED